MFILKKGHQPGVYVPLRALFLVYINNDTTTLFRSLFRNYLIPSEKLIIFNIEVIVFMDTSQLSPRIWMSLSELVNIKSTSSNLFCTP